MTQGFLELIKFSGCTFPGQCMCYSRFLSCFSIAWDNVLCHRRAVKQQTWKSPLEDTRWIRKLKFRHLHFSQNLEGWILFAEWKLLRRCHLFTETPNHQLQLLQLYSPQKDNSFPHQFEHSCLFTLHLMECWDYWKMFCLVSFYLVLIFSQTLNFPIELVYKSNQTGHSLTLPVICGA